LVRRLAARLDQAEARLLQRKLVSARGRVAQLLLDLSGTHAVPGPGGGLLLQLPLSLAELGMAIGLAPPAMARMVQALQRDGILAVRGRTLVISDRDRLMAEIH
jgi:CRP-like cAMP-binding protein